jgi:MSHA biogenesis protein MshG
VRLEDVFFFSRQLSSLVNAGVTLLESLTSILNQIKIKRLKDIIYLVRKDIEAGQTFSGALEKHPSVFSPLVVNMVRAGEKAGVLGESLVKLSGLLEKEISTKRKISSAMRYPLYVMVSLCVGFFVIIMMVIPRFESIYTAAGTDLPLPTRMLIGINEMLSHYWLLSIFILAGGIYIVRKWLQMPGGRLWVDRYVLTLPILGDLLSKLMLSRFFHMLSTMLASGINITQALTVSANVAENSEFSLVVNQVKEDIIRGESMSVSIARSSLFPPVAVQMVAVGEKTGNLGEMLKQVADYFDAESDYNIENLSSAIEPLLVVILGLMVVLLALGVFLPMWDFSKLYFQ